MPTAKKAAPKKTVVKRTVEAPETKNDGPLGELGRYHLRLEVNDEVMEGNTDAIAVSVLAMKPPHLSTKVVIRASLAGVEDGKEVTQFYMIPRARRLFGNRMSADMLEKAILMGLDDYHV